eukprot:31163-Pelagococcus_subviridis.AAC.5
MRRETSSVDRSIVFDDRSGPRRPTVPIDRSVDRAREGGSRRRAHRERPRRARGGPRRGPRWSSRTSWRRAAVARGGEVRRRATRRDDSTAFTLVPKHDVKKTVSANQRREERGVSSTDRSFFPRGAQRASHHRYRARRARGRRTDRRRERARSRRAAALETPRAGAREAKRRAEGGKRRCRRADRSDSIDSTLTSSSSRAARAFTHDDPRRGAVAPRAHGRLPVPAQRERVRHRLPRVRDQRLRQRRERVSRQEGRRRGPSRASGRHRPGGGARDPHGSVHVPGEVSAVRDGADRARVRRRGDARAGLPHDRAALLPRRARAVVRFQLWILHTEQREQLGSHLRGARPGGREDRGVRGSPVRHEERLVLLRRRRARDAQQGGVPVSRVVRGRR